jgi:transcriptional regulator with XRE-family HTH domain
VPSRNSRSPPLMPSIRRSPLHLALRDMLIRRRGAAGLTQAELADRMGRPQPFISKVENGERRLDVVEFLEFAEALGCSAEKMLTELKRVAVPVSAPAASVRRRRKN